MTKSKSPAPPGPLDLEQIKDAASDAAEIAAHFIKKHPLECVGGALLAGLLVGIWIGKK